MRFRLAAPSTAPYWLIGNPALNERDEASQTNECGLQITRETQIVRGAGYDNKKAFDRGNQGVVFTPSSYRQFETEWDRMDFVSRLAPSDPALREHEWQGDVYLRIDRGTEYREWLLPDAAIALSGVSMEGEIGLRLNYTIQVGGIGEAATGGVSEVNLIGYQGGGATLVVTGAELDAQYAAVNDDIQSTLVVALFWSGFGAPAYIRQLDSENYRYPYADSLPGLISSNLELIATEIQEVIDAYEMPGAGAWVEAGALHVTTGTYYHPDNTVQMAIQVTTTAPPHLINLEWAAEAGPGDPVRLIGFNGTAYRNLTGHLN